MTTEMEQRAPELTRPQPELSPCIEASSMAKASINGDENKHMPKDTLSSSRAWLEPQSIRKKSKIPGGGSLKVETSPTVLQTNNMSAKLEDMGLPKPSDGLPVPNMNCDSVSPVSPTVMKDLQFDSRFISDAWSYEAPQNMYALLTQPTNQMDPMSNGTGLMTPFMQLQEQQQQQLQLHQQQQLEQQLEHGFPLQMSPIHGSGLTSLYMSGAPLAISPRHMMMQQSANAMSSGFSSTPTTVSLSDMMTSADPGIFLSQNGSPTHLIKQHSMPPMAHSGSVMNVKDLTLNELRPHFNKPMAVVAKELGVCITLMKKICRRNGLVRWPHRRIRSLVNRITSLQVLASNATGPERKRFQGQIASLREELSAVIQNPNEKSRKAQTDIKIPIKAKQLIATNSVPIAEITNGMVGPAEVPVDTNMNANEVKKGKKKSTMTISSDTKGFDSLEKDKSSDGSRKKKRKPSFGLHAHQPPPIKIPRLDELPSMSRLRSQSVPERRVRGDRRQGRTRDEGTDISSSCQRPSTSTHRNGRRGSISSILNDSPE